MLTVLVVALSLLTPVDHGESQPAYDQALTSPLVGLQGWGWTIGGATAGLILGGTAGAIASANSGDPMSSPVLVGLGSGLLSGLAGAGLGYLLDTGHPGVVAGIALGGAATVGVAALGVYLAYCFWTAVLTGAGEAIAHTPSFL